jgi:glycosyltransferase involved in cell wall biosynthesis
MASFDFLHLHSLWQFPTFAAARAAWRAKVPYFVLLNGMLDRYSISQRSRWIKRVYWWLREGKIEGRSNGLQCMNDAEIERAVPWITNMPKFILGNGIDEDRLHNLPPRGRFRTAHPELADKPLVLFLSRLHPKKGLHRLLPEWHRIAEQVPAARLLVAGTGDPDYVNSLHQLVTQHHLQDHVLFLGQLVGEEKWEALRDADVFVLPTYQEGFSMAVTEALAAGCPPVVTFECNFAELEPPPPGPPSGVIIKNGDMPAFAQAVIRLLQDPERRHSLAAAGQKLLAARFTWQKIAAALEKAYRYVLSGRSLLPDAQEIWRN